LGKIRISIRFLLILICVAGALCAWFSWKLRQAGNRDRFVSQLIEHGGQVAFADQFDGSNSRMTPYAPKPTLFDTSVRSVFGTNPFKTLRWVQANHADTSILSRYSLAHEIHILLLDCSATQDADLDNFKAYTETRVLNLQSASISDKAFTTIERFHRLEELWLGDTQVSDRGIRSLSKSPSLRVLDVRRTPITDEGLEAIAEMPNLCLLYLGCELFSANGLQSLNRSPHLSSLWLEFQGPAKTDLKPILEIETLRDLTLEGSFVDDRLLESLEGNQHIQSLMLLRCDELSERAIDILLRIPNLKGVRFSGNSNISKESMDRFKERFPQ
jgi:hypothetical protein